MGKDRLGRQANSPSARRHSLPVLASSSFSSSNQNHPRALDGLNLAGDPPHVFFRWSACDRGPEVFHSRTSELRITVLGLVKSGERVGTRVGANG